MTQKEMMKQMMEMMEKQSKDMQDLKDLAIKLDKRVTALEKGNVSAKKSTSKKTASSKKQSTKKSTAPKSNDFDRAKYEATAKKLGVWREDLGKVCKADRPKVYKAMGL